MFGNLTPSGLIFKHKRYGSECIAFLDFRMKLDHILDLCLFILVCGIPGRG